MSRSRCEVMESSSGEKDGNDGGLGMTARVDDDRKICLPCNNKQSGTSRAMKAEGYWRTTEALSEHAFDRKRSRMDLFASNRAAILKVTLGYVSTVLNRSSASPWSVCLRFVNH